MESNTNRPYIIYRRKGAGFWSNFFWIMEGLEYADRHGLVPVVDMERYPSRYTETSEEAALELGTRNGWEYYFEQPALTLAEALAADPLDNKGIKNNLLDVRHGDPAQAYPIAKARALREKYVRVKPDILRQADVIIPPGQHENILGVHVRGTDLLTGDHISHPLTCPMICYLERAVALDQKHHFGQIFLATDELESVTAFHEQFGPRLVTIDAHRTPANQETARDYQWLFGHDRPFHRYRLGLEVLLDVLLLARCGHLLGSMSSVIGGARMFASEAQQLHILPPLWWTADSDKTSQGFLRTKLFGDLPAGFSEAAHLAIIDVLRRNLARVEGSCGTALQRSNEIGRKTEAQRAHIAELQAQNQAIREKIQEVRADLKHARVIINRLQRRVLKLVDAWTRLGWIFFPWTRPAWRKAPLQDCEIT
jgi:hypothetical protein